HALWPIAAATLTAKFGGGRALDIPAVTDGDDLALVGNEVDGIDLALLVRKIRQARCGILLPDDVQLLFDDGQPAAFAGDDVHEISDLNHYFIVFLLQLVALQTRELVELEFHDGLHLALIEAIGVALHLRLAADDNAQG